MSALTADRAVPSHKQIIDGAYFVDFPVAATTVIFAGGFVGLNAVGNLVMHAPETLSATQGTHRFVGIAQEHIASQTSAGDKNCRVMVEGYFKHALTAATIADVGKGLYVTDSATLAKTGVCSIDAIAKVAHLESSAVVVAKLNGFGTGPGEVTRIINGFAPLTAGSTVMLLHETENHNGGWVADLTTVNNVAIDTDGTDGIVTLSHTTGTETSLGITLTYLDNQATLTVTVSSTAGKSTGVGSATADVLVAIPADVAVMAVLTTQAAGSGTPTVNADIICKMFLK